jgi:hypothetical protein
VKRCFVAAAFTALALASSACLDDLTAPSLVARPRVLAGRASVVGNPSQAYPAPGETLAIEWLVSAPNEIPAAGWSMLACPGEVAPTGDRFCTGAPFGIFSSPITSDPIRFEVAVPADVAATEVLMQGNVCFGSDPNLDPATVIERPCIDPAAMVERVRYGIRIARDGLTNRNPSIPAIARIEDQIWPAPIDAPPAANCESETGPALPAVSAGGGAIVLGIDPEPADLEMYTTAGQTRTESLLFSHAATAGELARFFSIVEDPSATVRVDWTPPAVADVPEGGLTVRVYFIVRDQRAGLNWTERALCVVR